MITSIKSQSNKAKEINKHYYIKQHKPLANLAAITYTFSAYICGVNLLFISNFILNIIGVFLITHSLVYSAYLTHEFMHGTIFKTRRWNSVFGNIMLWLNGGCYNGFRSSYRSR